MCVKNVGVYVCKKIGVNLRWHAYMLRFINT
jgi:hypothetical protein